MVYHALPTYASAVRCRLRTFHYLCDFHCHAYVVRYRPGFGSPDGAVGSVFRRGIQTQYV